jgi:uncharacterized membrane protein YkgB
MSNVLVWLDGNKTYICAAGLGVVTFLFSAQIIDQPTANKMNTIIGALLAASLRHAMYKMGK